MKRHYPILISHGCTGSLTAIVASFNLLLESDKLHKGKSSQTEKTNLAAPANIFLVANKFEQRF